VTGQLRPARNARSRGIAVERLVGAGGGAVDATRLAGARARLAAVDAAVAIEVGGDVALPAIAEERRARLAREILVPRDAVGRRVAAELRILVRAGR
jgi:hypothetical protein